MASVRPDVAASHGPATTPAVHHYGTSRNHSAAATKTAPVRNAKGTKRAETSYGNGRFLVRSFAARV